MALHASEFIWSESVEDLAYRWEQREKQSGRKVPMPSRELAERLRRRAEAVRRYISLPEARPMQTRRQWEASWDAPAAEKKMREALAALGWKVRVVERRNISPQALAAGAPLDENTVVIERPLAAERAERYVRGGLALPFSTADALVILMAEELFHVAADRIGQQPAFPLVEDLAPHVFTQDVLGLPFSPWAADFIDDGGR